ncbi:MAG TPA: hypothetical protein VFJ93_11340 [Gaiellaceae bacterium]|jgi:hypothetical protein|nr:hypothetical protein [Gaiellaceae bacterium]
MASLEEESCSAILLVTTPFESLARSQIKRLGLSEARIVVIEHPLYGIGPEELSDRVRAAAPAIVAALTGEGGVSE